MSDLSDAIREGKSTAVLDGLYLTTYPSPVINVSERTREMTSADVDAIRAAITEAGYRSVEEWLPRQGASWLSAGISVGVSFRLRKVATDA